jgi:hypothetical protein
MKAVLVALLLVACAAPVQTEAEPTPEPPGFDLERVQANFTDECQDPIAVDQTFCDQVDIAGMRVEDGTILIVPTFISATGMEPRAAAICEVFARVHFDGATGEDLGYETIGILDREGGNAAACTVQR